MNLSLNTSEREQAFKQLFEKYYAPFCLYAKRFIEDQAEREDIVSDVFATLWDKSEWTGDRFDSPTTVAYIKMCVKNSCLNYLKHQEYAWNYQETLQKNRTFLEEEADSVYTLDELYRMLYETLSKLPESHRDVFKKSFFEGKSQAEIAEELNLSLKTVGRYKQRTMELLKQEFKDYLPFLLLLTIN